MNVLVIEDENKTAQLLKEMIENHTDYLVVNICQSITSSVSYLKKNQEKLDLIFMDIQLSDGESFEIFNLIDVTKPVIFCTAFNDYLLNAFKNKGIDYILKPFQQKDVDTALNKVDFIKTAFTANIGTKLKEIQKKPTFQTSFIVQQKEKMIPLSVVSIAHIFIECEVVYALTFDNQKSAIFKSLDEIESVLNPQVFFRINRQMIVNRNAIRDIVPYFNRKVIVNLTVKNNDKAIVSRLKVSPFKTWLEKPE
jgi:two-component system, LytTR family, response regulator LytT